MEKYVPESRPAIDVARCHRDPLFEHYAVQFFDEFDREFQTHRCGGVNQYSWMETKPGQGLTRTPTYVHGVAHLSGDDDRTAAANAIAVRQTHWAWTHYPGRRFEWNWIALYPELPFPGIEEPIDFKLADIQIPPNWRALAINRLSEIEQPKRLRDEELARRISLVEKHRSRFIP
jgi:hypothetical protein